MPLDQAATLNQRQDALRITGQTVHCHGQNDTTHCVADMSSFSAFSYLIVREMRQSHLACLSLERKIWMVLAGVGQGVTVQTKIVYARQGAC